MPKKPETIAAAALRLQTVAEYPTLLNEAQAKEALAELGRVTAVLMHRLRLVRDATNYDLPEANDGEIVSRNELP
jgi:hypothetical protein